MKKYTKIIVALLLVLTGCSSVDNSLNKNITQPIVKNEPKLIYPISAQEKNITGNTSVMFIISSEGTVTQTRINKSSGDKALDIAAENYCKQLEFFPATENGTPISSTMKWEVKFNLDDFSTSIQNKIYDVKDLYKEIAISDKADKQDLEREVLDIHDDCANNLKDALKINDYLYSVVLPNVSREWKTAAGNHPLTFLLYHDFLNRFKDFDSLSIVKEKMKLALKRDVQLLNTEYSTSKISNEKNAALLQKIKSFVESHYPEINLQEINFKNVNRDNNIS